MKNLQFAAKPTVKSDQICYGLNDKTLIIDLSTLGTNVKGFLSFILDKINCLIDDILTSWDTSQRKFIFTYIN